MRGPVAWLQRVLSELHRRSVFDVAAVYAAVTFVLLQVADLVFPVLPLPEATYQVLVYAAIVGFPIALVLAWFFDLTARGIQRTPAETSSTTTGWIRPRFQFLSLSVIAVLLVTAGSVAAIRVKLGDARADDGRVAVAVFPFRTVGVERGEWSEGVADLLSTALDGTEGVRVVDPWSLWNDLRESPNGPASSPDPARAAELARDAGARRVVLGSAVASGGRIELSLRLYDPRFPRALDTFSLSGKPDEMPDLVQRLAVGVIARVWDDQDIPGLTPLEPNLTRSADALKAYLAAKMAMRRGMIDSANVAIDRAIALDSTFSLALVDAVGIKTWHQFANGQQFSGFFALLDRAMAHDDSLSERNKLRLEAMLASVQTRGAASAEAARRIIEIDSTDLGAWSLLSYVHNVYGWQYGASEADMLQAADRVVQLDSGFVPGRISQAWIRLGLADSLDAQTYVDLLTRTDTLMPIARRTLNGLRAIAVDDQGFDTIAGKMAGVPIGEWIVPYRYLRTYRPDRAEELLVRLLRDQPQTSGPDVLAEQLGRLRIAQGNTVTVDSALRTGTYTPMVLGNLRRALVGNALIGMGDSAAARHAVDALATRLPVDSALAYFNTQPAWWSGWLIGAYNAQVGDTVLARRWHQAIGTFPAGGSPATYREALQSDIAARLAVRAGDRESALHHARKALEQWSIHTENQPESMPEPSMRFHLAILLRDAAKSAEAEPLLRSLTPPTTWMGYLTARASFELGELISARGDKSTAARHYANALRLWEAGGPEVARWRQQVEDRLSRLEARE